VKHGRKTNGLSAAALEVLQDYDFPGNVRELANVIERAVIMSEGKRLEAKDLPEGFRAAAQTLSRREQPLSLAEVEAGYIADTLAATRGNKSEAARILGISRKNLYERLARSRKDEGEKTKQPR